MNCKGVWASKRCWASVGGCDLQFLRFECSGGWAGMLHWLGGASIHPMQRFIAVSFFERGLTSCPGSRGTAASPTPIQQNSPPLTNVSIRERDRCMRVIAIASPTELPAKIRPCTNPKSTSSRFRPSERRPTHQNHRTTTYEILATHCTLLGEDRRRDGDLGS